MFRVVRRAAEPPTDPVQPFRSGRTASHRKAPALETTARSHLLRAGVSDGNQTVSGNRMPVLEWQR